jgi:hypothetical protein
MNAHTTRALKQGMGRPGRNDETWEKVGDSEKTRVSRSQESEVQ